MGSERRGSPGHIAPGRREVLRWSLAVGATGVALTFAIAAMVLVHDGTHPTVRPRAVVPAPDHARDQSSRIVFASRGDSDGRYHIHIVNPDGTGDTALTSGPDEDRTPAWSPNRDLIAFTRVFRASDPTAEVTHIYIMHADGSGLVQLTDGPGETKDPSWSPDGTRIVFTARNPSSDTARLVVTNVDGTAPIQPPEPPAGCLDQEPAWSPDGSTIAFARKCGDEPSALYVMHLDGSALLELTTFGRTPAWSPDGSKIAYTGLGTYGPAVYVINVDGTGKVELTDDLSGDPVWSPDGSRIVFTLNEVAVLKLYVINADGSGIRRLTDTSSSEVAPSW